MNQPSVCIIVPVYNVEPYVEDCIRSVMRQTYDGFMECIVVDDCGTDDSMAVVERLISEYNGPIAFKVLHHEHNRGLSAARNTGIDAATSDFLFFLDSDDEITNDCIKKLSNDIIKDSSIEIVQGNTKSIPESTPDGFLKKITISHVYTNDMVRTCYFKNHQLSHNAWNKLIKRSFVLNNVLYFKEGILYEDLLWTFNFLKYAINVCFVSDVTYYYRIRPNSIMTNTDEREITKNYKIVYSEIISNLTKSHEKEELVFYVNRCSDRYISENSPEFDVIFNLFWNNKKYYGFYSCYKIFAIAYLRKKSKVFGGLYVFFIRLKHLIQKIYAIISRNRSK